MSAFVLAHLSDPHLPPMPRATLYQLAGKRTLGYLNWKRKRAAVQRRDVLDALVADLHAQQPDHVAVTGDLVNIGLPQEYPPALAWLTTVGPPDRVSVVPGNHDVYVRQTERQFDETFAAYLRGDDVNATGRTPYPYLRRRGPVALIGLSSAIPTAPLMATGRLGGAQLRALDRLLAQLAGEPLFRLVMIHHPPTSQARFKRLVDGDDLLALLQRRRVEMLIHGHDHVHSTTWFEGPHGSFPAVGVPSASAIAHGRSPAAACNYFEITRADDAWTCVHTIRAVDDSLKVETLSRTQLIR